MKPKKPPQQPQRQPQYYLLELGLDPEIGPEIDGTYPLVRAFALWDPTPRPGAWGPAWSTQFQPGDWVAFRIFDFSPSATTLSLLDPRVFEVHFLDPRQSTLLKSPFSSTNPAENNPIIIAANNLRRTEGVRSAATGSPIGWLCFDGVDRKGSPYLPGELAVQISTD